MENNNLKPGFKKDSPDKKYRQVKYIDNAGGEQTLEEKVVQIDRISRTVLTSM